MSTSGLRAPLYVPIEIASDAGRVFRLSSAVGEDGARLGRAAPFERGRPVQVRFTLPDGPTLTARAVVEAVGDEPDEAGGRALRFIDPPAELRAALHAYVVRRLGLPGG